MTRILAALLAIAVCAAPPAAAAADPVELVRHRSRGVALYEGVASDGPLDQNFAGAAREFEAAWRASGDPLDRFNYGLALLRQDARTKARPELEAVARARPDDPAPLYALAILAMGDNDWQGAVTRLDQALALDPGDPAARFQRAWVLQDKLQRSADAQRDFEEVLKIGQTRGGLHFVQALYVHAHILRFQAVETGDKDLLEQVRRELDLFQRYSDMLGVDKPSEAQLREGPLLKPRMPPAPRPVAQASPGAPPADTPPARRLSDATARAGLAARRPGPWADAGARPGVAACQLLGDPRPELLEWGNGPPRLWAPGAKGRYGDATARAGLSVVKDDRVRAVACGDADKDGDADLFFANEGRDRLLRNDGGRFVDVTAGAGVGAVEGSSRDAAWLDVDADGDLDLYVARAGRNDLWENGGARFAATGGVAGLTEGEADSRALAVFDHDGDNDLDILVANAAPWTFLFSSLREGRYEEASRRVGLADDDLRATGVEARDLDGDGRSDLVLDTEAGSALLLRGAQGFVRRPLPPGPPRAVAAALDDGGRYDLVRHDGIAAEVWAWSPGPDGAPGWVRAAALPAAGAPIAAIRPADVDRDGDDDLVVATASGLRLWTNDLRSERWVRVALRGERNNRAGAGAHVEVRAGAHYVLRVADGGDVTLGLGGHGPADVVRVTWPNGILQNVVGPASGATVEIVETKAQAGSCPFLYAFDGGRMVFVADVLGAAPLGIPMGPGRFLPQDPTEYVLVEAAQLRPDPARGGRLRLAVTEELREEVTYLDAAALLAVDHPADTRVVPNERYSFPPGPEFRIFAWPRSAERPFRSIRDTFGNDVTAELSAVDGRRVQGWILAPGTYRGLVEEHAYVFDPADAVPDGAQAWLIAHGWVFWGGGGTARSTMQDPRYAFGPVRLDVKDEGGAWVAAIPDIGFPAGKSRYMPVDLTAALARAPAGDKRFRIVTNLRLTWDAFELVVDPSAVDVRTTRLAPAEAALSWRGFSERIDDDPTLSERFDYHRLRPPEDAPWDQAPGRMTRYGDLLPLLLRTDDQFAVFGAGDQLELTYDPAALPPLPSAAWRRDWLAFFDGYNKDGDFNNAASQQVEPLPFHAMSSYPWPAGEHPPATPAHERYVQEWNTRDGRRLVPPLRPLAAAPPP